MNETKGQMAPKFDEFTLILLGAVIFIGILAVALSTPSEFPPRLSPIELTIDMEPGESYVFDFNITRKLSRVNASTTGQIASWITLSDTQIGITNGFKKVTARIDVPDFVDPGTYTGKIVVRSREGRADIDVTVVIPPVRNLEARTFELGSFYVTYLDEIRELDTRESYSVRKNHFGGDPLTLVAEIEAEDLTVVDSAAVRLNVDSTNNYGPLIVTQNGEEVFKETVGPGEVFVPLNASDVQGFNTVVVSSGGPGIFFWATNTYDVSDVALEIGFDGQIERKFSFDATEEEVRKLDHLQLTFLVNDADIPVPELRVKVNDQTVFLKTPSTGIFNENLVGDLFGASIRLEEENTIELSFDQKGRYEVGEASLTIFSRAGLQSSE